MAPAQGGQTEGIAAPVDHVDWQESSLYGAGTWVGALLASYAIVVVAGVTADAAGGTLDLAYWALYESMGGFAGVEVPSLFGGDAPPRSITSFAYGTLGSRFYGLGIVAHYLVPPVALAIGGHVAAGRYLEEAGAGDDGATLDAWIAGVSIAAAFGILTLLGRLVFEPSGGVELPGIRLLLAAVAYPVVFAGVGAARRVGYGVATLRGFLGGVGAFALAFVLWYLLEDPLGPTSMGDLGGAAERLPVFGFFLAEHGVYLAIGSFLGTDATVGSPSPNAVVLAGPLLVAAGLAYRAEITDPLRAAAQGARIAVGYAVGVLLLTLAVLGNYMNQFYDRVYGTGTTQEVRNTLFAEANEIFGGMLPDVVVVAGVLWAVVVGAAGGAIGAKVVASQRDESAGADTEAADAAADGGAAAAGGDVADAE